MRKNLHEVIKGLDFLDIQGAFDHPITITGLCYDSRECVQGNIFFALPGIHSDGRNYILDALERGASTILYEGALNFQLQEEMSKSRANAERVFLRVADCRYAMSAVACSFYDNPSDSLCVIGVTGTEGKSTTVWLIYQLLNAAGINAGFFSTVMSDTGDGPHPNPQHQTTPEATAVHQMLAQMRDHGMRYAVVEASSHGLSKRTARLAHVHFDIGVITNVTHEHLEFHGTWEQYRSDKANLFRRLGEMRKPRASDLGYTPTGIICSDDSSAEYFAREAQVPCITYSSKGTMADLQAVEICNDVKGSQFIIEGVESLEARSVQNGYEEKVLSSRSPLLRLNAYINLPGKFNVQNVLGAILAASVATGKPWKEFVPFLPRLSPVRGRMQRIFQGQPFEVIIDYAHTPSSFAEILPSVRKNAKDRIICVFGSAGERDRAKRPQQGRIAADNCDIVILADEDPRGESSMSILEEIASGCPELARETRLFLIPDRATAIRKAFSLAHEGDLVLLLGKGHENSIIYSDHIAPYDEERTARAILAEMGFNSKGICS